MNSGLQEPVLDSRQQMVGQHTKENVSLRPIFQMMKNRPLHQGALDVPECIFHSSQQNISAPDFIGRQILPVRLENIATVQFFGDRLFIRVFFPREVLIGGVIGDLVITRDARIALQ